MRAQFIGQSSVFIFQPMDSPNLEDAVTWGKPRIQHNDGYDLSPLQKIEIGLDQHAALTQTYRIRGGLGGFAKVIYFVTNASVFMIEFNDLQSKFEENEPTFDRMLASFRIIE